MKTDNPIAVLVVDDEPNIVKSLSRLLQRHDFEVTAYTDPAEALASAPLKDMDVVLSDMRMPQMSGTELLAQVAEQAPDVARVLLTGFADMTSTIEAVNQGHIYAYLQKPWQDDQLVNMLQKAAAHARLRKENQRLLEQIQEQNRKLAFYNKTMAQTIKQQTSEVQQAFGMVESTRMEMLNSFKAFVQVLSSLVEMRPGMTRGFALEVAHLCQSMGERAKLDPSAKIHLYYAALLHEIGKMALPQDLLDKPPGELPPKKWEMFAEYPEIGELVLAPVASLGQAASIIHQHREYLDGSGFPRGIKGDAISREARILCMARDYTAMLRGHEFGRKHSLVEAKQLLRSRAGVLYDKELVKLFIGMDDEHRIAAPSMSSGHAIPLAQLRPGMKLARPVYNQHGLSLLGAHHVVSESDVERLMRIMRRTGLSVEIYVEDPLGA
jgi:response regulator RpfG family c-di-GMP phosphodiesterase